jgi:hypothetical protein
MLEPHSLCRDDRKRPDGLIVMLWDNGRCLIWDFTCSDTLAASHLNRAALNPCAGANDAESCKTVKYRMQAPLYIFMPVQSKRWAPLVKRPSPFCTILVIESLLNQDHSSS